jgi:hypothetical protein
VSKSVQNADDDVVGRPRKRLADLIHDGTFVARKHERLLADDGATPWDELEQLRTEYRAATTPTERRDLALVLERAVRGGGARRWPNRWLWDLERERRLREAGAEPRPEAWADDAEPPPFRFV